MVVTSLIAITGVSMVYSLFRRVTWRRLLCFATLGSNSLISFRASRACR